MIIEENIPLSRYTTFRIGGLARYFARVSDEKELAEAVRFAKKTKLPFFALGGGSNILMSDYGFSGLVIKNEIKGIEYLPKEADIVEMIVGAGESWDEFVEDCVIEGLGGLENLSGIPGTVGAAPVQNIGAYGMEVKDAMSWVEAYDTEKEIKQNFSAEECRFAYRDSFFKTLEGKKYIITRVGFLLSENQEPNLSYKDIQAYMKENNLNTMSVAQTRVAVLAIRARKLPDWREIGTAGSFFKNPLISEADYEIIKIKIPDLPCFSVGGGLVKIPAAWLLDKVCNFNGVTRGQVGVYKNQALVIVNNGNATAKEVDTLAKEMKKCVQEKTGITLLREVESVGAF